MSVAHSFLAGPQPRDGSPGLHVQLFGSLKMRFGANAFFLSAPPKTPVLLVYLLLNREILLERKTVARELWPLCSPDEARANLRRHLSYLKRALPRCMVPWVVVSNRIVSWNADAPLFLDVDVFERLSASEEYAKAIVMYEADLCEQIAEPWIAPHRARLRSVHFQNLSRGIEAAKSRGDVRTVQEFAQRMLRLDPLREDAVRALMHAQLVEGDRVGALRSYSAYAERLYAELALEPLPETEALASQIRGA